MSGSGKRKHQASSSSPYESLQGQDAVMAWCHLQYQQKQIAKQIKLLKPRVEVFMRNEQHLAVDDKRSELPLDEESVSTSAQLDQLGGSGKITFTERTRLRANSEVHELHLIKRYIDEVLDPDVNPQGDEETTKRLWKHGLRLSGFLRANRESSTSWELRRVYGKSGARKDSKRAKLAAIRAELNDEL